MGGVKDRDEHFAAWSDEKLRAFALWCAVENMIEDTEAPHGEAFSAGYDAGGEDEYHRYLRSAVT